MLISRDNNSKNNEFTIPLYSSLPLRHWHHRLSSSQNKPCSNLTLHHVDRHEPYQELPIRKLSYKLAKPILLDI
ncbi:hypothetical protein HZ326_8049 [Fusarium oxysporum f. sp. albedinis]|nr:hypothetical protein HZ326_8049 [Fusarium oxysporum f. sp. albedinis]